MIYVRCHLAADPAQRLLMQHSFAQHAPALRAVHRITRTQDSAISLASMLLTAASVGRWVRTRRVYTGTRRQAS